MKRSLSSVDLLQHIGLHMWQHLAGVQGCFCTAEIWESSFTNLEMYEVVLLHRLWSTHWN